MQGDPFDVCGISLLAWISASDLGGISLFGVYDGDAARISFAWNQSGHWGSTGIWRWSDDFMSGRLSGILGDGRNGDGSFPFKCCLGRAGTLPEEEKGKRPHRVCAVPFVGRYWEDVAVRKKDLIRGSLTIETACLMPVILLVIFSLLALCFYVHNRCYLTAAALEASLTGALEEHREGGEPREAADVRARERGSVGFYGMENLSVEVNAGKNKIQILYQGETPVLYGGFRLQMESEGEAEILNPVEKIRRLRVLRGESKR